ncbi:MAG: arsenate reductase [Gemmatimonadales bacterium]|nr:MAG: arsenate reductase [Gemmatimonadales bacterium]
MTEKVTEVQIFGTAKCSATRKAQRFFKERRVRIHFVELKERPASPGELRRFQQKFGTEALLDRESRAFRDRGLHAAHLSDKRIAELLVEDPLLLRTPLVRAGARLSIGLADDVWKDWV